ncbi:MAG: dockerin type I domain-containing protein [Oscillospiraceae bacterium]|nr:dockerin type I domain-containing protein [Oscillospiraceae bacterium]
MDISVVKTDSAGVATTIPVENQEVEIELPIAFEEGSVTVYHIADSGTEVVTPVTVSGNVVKFTAPSFSTYYIDGNPATVDSTNIADSVTLKLEEVTTGVAGSYYIRLYADEVSGATRYINRFMAAELAFELDDSSGYDITNIGAVSITPASYINVVNNGNGEYEFNVNGDIDTSTGEEVSDITGAYVTLGILNVTGDGNFRLLLNNDSTTFASNTANQVQTAEYSNNIVSTYTVDGSTLNYSSPVASGNIQLKQTQLTINVLFPNTVSAQAVAYNDMKVTLNGVNMTNNEIDFGGDSLTATGATISAVDGTSYDYEDATGYTTTVTVYRNYATTLVFEGAGYRTYRTSITPSGSTATVTVWNNAMSQDMYVATSTDNAMGSIEKAVTFLAGDIVADENINLYDLSAVVSYFGKENTVTAASEFAKYDLDRDGKIDSKDIAMVLVSWDK